MEQQKEMITRSRTLLMPFFDQLASDLQIITNANVKCEGGDVVLVKSGDLLSHFFKDSCLVSKAKEDGKDSGHVHLVIDVETGIATSGFMMMLEKESIDEKISKRNFDEEIAEGFQEVANLLTGATNTVMENLGKGHHLFLQTTSYCESGQHPDTLQLYDVYLAATVDIQVEDYISKQAVWLFPKEVVEDLLQ
ncbi:MAG: hypothetical protein HQL71_04610 [Magnetococcales bacterium]|nr:hypothetical protein [Magnetococcales bacterium]